MLLGIMCGSSRYARRRVVIESRRPARVWRGSGRGRWWPGRSGRGDLGAGRARHGPSSTARSRSGTPAARGRAARRGCRARPPSDIEKHLRRAELKLAKPTPGLPWRGSWAGNGTTTAVGYAEHRGCRLRPQTGGGNLVEWTPAGWRPLDLVAGLRGRATPTAPAALPAAGGVWLTASGAAVRSTGHQRLPYLSRMCSYRASVVAHLTRVPAEVEGASDRTGQVRGASESSRRTAPAMCAPR